MTTKQQFEVFQSIAVGIKNLRDLTEAGDDDSSPNHARVVFCAISAYLLENGLLEALTNCGMHLRTHGSAQVFGEQEESPVS